MAIEGLFHQTTSGVDALDLRRTVAALSGGIPGIINSSDLVGTATSTTNFRVSAGTALVNHNTAGNGQFVVTNEGNADQTINAPGSGTKYITVYLRVQDATLGDGANACTITKQEETTAVYGIPAGQSGIELYRIILPSGATLTSGATITDVRPYVNTNRGVIVQRTTALSIPQDTTVAIPWPTELRDTDGYHSTVTNTERLTIPAGLGGLYEVGANVGWSAPGLAGDTLGIKVCRFYKNGVSFATHEIPNTRWATFHSLSLPIQLVPGDYIEITLLQNFLPSQGSLYENSGGGPPLPQRAWLTMIANA